MANPKPTTLIKTKISIPLIREDIVPRPRLLKKLDRCLQKPLTLVCAGAGFGKTTLVSAWARDFAAQKEADTHPRMAWLSLDEHDSDLRQFLHYFAAAIRTVFPSACAQTLGLLRNQAKPSSAVLAVMTDDLLQLPSPVVIVLDDYHTVRGTAVHDLLNELLLHWPQPLHLVLISRYTPPLPLARLRANSKVVEMRNNDLRFTPDEAAAYVNRVWDIPLNQTSLELLMEKTEGWIASLQLASLTLRASQNIDTDLVSLSGSDADIAEYLVDEVLARQPRPIQLFLLKISILDQFCASLCTAVTLSKDPEWSVEAILEQLIHNNLFIIPLDKQQEWYRFHHLFSDLLRHRLIARFSPDEVADLHRKAAQWFAQKGLLDTAVLHALKAQDLNLAAEFMEQNLCNVLNREDPQTLNRWLHMLPEEFIVSRPGLLIMKAWIYSFAWRIDVVGQVIQRVEALLDEREETTASNAEHHPILLGQIAALKSLEAFHKGQSALSVTYGQDALTLLPPTWAYPRGGVTSYLALGMQAVGDGRAAEEILLERYDALLDKTDNYATRLIFTLSLVYLQAGKLEQAEQTARLFLMQAIQIESVLLQSWAHLILGLVSYQWNQLGLAGQHFEEILVNRHLIHSFLSRQGNAGAILVHLAAGRHQEAARMVARLREFDMEMNGRIDDLTQSLSAKTAYAANHTETARRWADSFPPPVTPILFILLELPQLTRAHILMGKDKTADNAQALQILNNLAEFAQQNHNVRRQIEVLAAQALALDIHGDAPAARMALKQAIELARPGGFIRVFLDLGPRIQKILATLVLPNTYTEFVRHIQEAFLQKPSPPVPVQPTNGKSHAHTTASPTSPQLIEPLTQREIEVLNLLREPVSPKEIALKLNISYSTVKRHTINLYGKLGVSSRWDAVAQAEALGIYASR